MKLPLISWSLLLIICCILIVALTTCQHALKRDQPAKIISAPPDTSRWQAPDTASIPASGQGVLIQYGRELIVHTSKYLGKKGSVAKISNGMNCQNCHLNAGALVFSNPFSAVASTYPKYRDRSGRVESIEFRINECLERSLNGKKLDSVSKEMKAMVAYLKWIGSDVPKNVKPKGTGVEELAFLHRAADPLKGKIVYAGKCKVCHGADGEGKLLNDSSGFMYPPLWGNQSYNVSAGMYRISRLAGYIKNSMPFGVTWEKPLLTDEESWDLAAYINSQSRPDKRFAYDWKKIETKPPDHPFGPFSDSFSERQHKYGPFGPIKKKKDKI